MRQKYKVFINDKSVAIIKNIKNCTDKNNNYHKYKSAPKLKKAIRRFIRESKKNNLFVLSNSHPRKKIFRELTAKYEQLEAAGGMVINENDELLFIFRRGKWDLPKGKVDKGEEIRDAALREVMEETGLTKVKIKGKAKETYHTYQLQKKEVLKKTYWFFMHAKKGQKLLPQKEEDITEVKWIKLENMDDILKHCYRSIRELIIESGLGQ